MKKIIITGGSGFIGSSFIRYLDRKNNYKILNIDKLTYAGNKDNLKNLKNIKNYYFSKTDINYSNPIKKILNRFKPNYIVHLAAETHVDRSIKDPDNFIKTNIIGTYNLIKESYHYWNNLKFLQKNQFRFLHVSTDEVFGDLQRKENYLQKTQDTIQAQPILHQKLVLII